jgi:hypothetical protein
MRRIKLLGLACIAMLSLASAVAATASATLPNVLPTTAGITFTSSSGKSAFGSAGLAEVTSETSKGTSASTGTEGNAGTFKTTFEKTKQALLGTCTGTGQSSGNVLVEGTYKDVNADLSGKEIVAVLFLLSPTVQFTCGSTAIAVEGCVAGQLTKASELTKTLTATLTRVSNDNEIITYLNASDVATACQLLAKVGAGSTELSAENTTQTLTKFEEGGKAIEVLLML